MISETLLEALDGLRRLEAGRHPLRNVPLSPPLLALLAQIIRSPGAHCREIAAALGVTAPTVSVAVRRLEAAGFVERRPDPDDRRVVRLFPTGKGRALHRQVQGFRRKKVNRLLAGLSPEERATLCALLQKALQHAEGGTEGGEEGCPPRPGS